MKRLLAPGIVGALVLSLGWAGAVPATDTAAATTGRAVVPRAQVRWGACPSDVADGVLRCSSIAVPLDHAYPRGAQVRLELSMRKHDPAAGSYLGKILVNPGGPGASGLWMAEAGYGLPGSIARRFDWIGFDPRGVAHSRPALRCDVPAAPVPLPWYDPSTTKRMAYWRREAGQVSAGCGSGTGSELLPHMTTADNARDMDSIRQALGVRRISFYGASYGTFLGETYAQLFPGHVDRMVLDGVIDPTKTWYRINFDQDRHFQSNFDRFWQYLADNDATFHLGTDLATVRDGFHAELTKLLHHPAYGGKVGPSDLVDGITPAGYYVFGWARIGRAYSRLVRFGDGRPFWFGARHGIGGGVYNAVECTDMSWPGWARTISDSQRVAAGAPDLTWSNTWMNAPCISWPARPHRRLHIGAFSRRVLLLSETYDAATPYSGALALRHLWPGARLVEGLHGTTHATGLFGSYCTRRAIARYLASRQLPRRAAGDRSDLQCAPVPPPSPTAARLEGRLVPDPWATPR